MWPIYFTLNEKRYVLMMRNKIKLCWKKHKSSSLNYKRKGFAALKTFFLRRKIIIAKSTGILWMCGRQKKSQGWNIICSQLSIQVFLTTYKSSGLKYYFQSAIKAIMVFSSWRPLQCLHFPIAKKHMKAKNTWRHYSKDSTVTWRDVSLLHAA